MQRINHFAAVVATLVYFVLGAAWYTFFSSQWLAGIGKTMEQLQKEVQGAAPYAICFVALLVIVYTLAWLMQRCGVEGAAAGAVFGGTLALGFIATETAINYGYEGRTVSLWLINVGYALVGMVLAGGIVGAWKKKP